MHLNNVTLEMSLKPFRQMDDAFVRSVCREVFTQWHALLRHSEVVSVMLWTADGSEILDYQGDLSEPLEWARYIGHANPMANLPNDPEGRALHSHGYLYLDESPVITYADLKRIVATLKEVGAEVAGKPVRVGATFDPGPEFARSPFKYERHPESCLGNSMGPTHRGFVTCYATLNADDRQYAGFPAGIPDQTPVGTFLGRQCRHFLTDLDFDYVWFSNGFGFGMETWRTVGALFDGERFLAERANELGDKILDFWRLFREECPDHRIETRGTNLIVGVDLATDATPYQRIYGGGFNMAPPPNSPWAALNGDFGLELVGYMSRLAELPDASAGFPFRFYTHDPWWLNSPWLDRYGREPHDIYLPLSVGRIGADGNVQNPNAIEFLTIDDSYGQMPVRVPNEVIPFLLEAKDHAPDAPGPVVWIYPWDEYHDLTFGDAPRLDEVFFGDWFMRGAVNQGLPLNTVVSSRNFLGTVRNPTDQTDPTERLCSLYRDPVLVSRVPDAGSALAEQLTAWVRSGGKLLLYGPTRHADARMLQLLNLAHAAPLDGELEVALAACPDALADSEYPSRLVHRANVCAGGCEETLADATDPHTEVLATVRRDGQERQAAIVRRQPDWNGGAVAWVRGTNAMSCHAQSHLPTPDDAATLFGAPMLMRFALAELGCTLAADMHTPDQRPPLVTVARRDNGFFFSGYTPNTTVGLRLRFPQGAPLLVGYETRLEAGHATYHLPRAWHRECRVFVDGQTDGEISCVEQHSGEIGIRRRLCLTGLQNATVRFYPEPGAEDNVKFLRAALPVYVQENWIPTKLRDHAFGRYVRAIGVTGSVLISW